MTFGEPIPADKKVEAVKYFSQQELGHLLIKNVIDAQPYHAGGWGGHVSLTTTGDGRYDVTVYVWKEEAKAA